MPFINATIYASKQSVYYILHSGAIMPLFRLWKTTPINTKYNINIGL